MSECGLARIPSHASSLALQPRWRPYSYERSHPSQPPLPTNTIDLDLFLLSPSSSHLPPLTFLLSPSSLQPSSRFFSPPFLNPPPLSQDARFGVYLRGVSEFVVESTQECLGLLNTANGRRATHSTAMNEASSRSHAILSLSVFQKKKPPHEKSLIAGKLFLVDLAGSERAKKSNLKGERLEEVFLGFDQRLYKTSPQP